MNNKSTLGIILSTGFALFSMFFGSGNLVFPLQIGRDNYADIFSATLGLLITGVTVPMLGAFVIMLFRGSYTDFFSSLGCRAEAWFPLLALSLMGPFGVLARCITVAHGSFVNVVPEFSAHLFILISCLVIFLFSLAKEHIVSLIGTILTPVLLLSLSFIFYQGFSAASHIPIQDQSFDLASFKEAALQGYQTMDLLAAFFFSAFIINNLKNQISGTKKSLPLLFSYSCVLGMCLLGGTYFMLVSFGGTYHELLSDIEPQQLLGAIAIKTLGSWAGIIICLCVMLACLTTGIVLAMLFSDFLRTQICQKKIGTILSMLITLSITYFVASLQFSGIAAFIGPILEVLYPVLIIVSLQSVFIQLGYISNQRWLFPIASVISLCMHLS